ncbi:hypothetical protein MUO14_06560 [Halobacillus shinanisalinarum]|uniref:PAS domain-containing protein n=1 Tax=Halobacillus shinanisalinarum TaxID=2932258 RepID=A0ABY4H4V4_9BACI|nr:hypothetical protein [Halobacillus shinanisalinarum]UOQ94607.1 hypothetical protein MUO14_06560 [Halobacillus shinanisalinarum]
MILIDVVEQIPLPAVVINQDGLVLSYNHLMESSLQGKMETGVSLKDAFSRWETSARSKIIMAESMGSVLFLWRVPYMPRMMFY